MNGEYDAGVMVAAPAQESIGAADIIRSSSVAAQEMLRRRGADAAGLTEEFDARNAAIRADLEKGTPDPDRRRRMVMEFSEKSTRYREALRQYEFGEVYKGAVATATKRADDSLYTAMEAAQVQMAKANVTRADALKAAQETLAMNRGNDIDEGIASNAYNEAVGAAEEQYGIDVGFVRLGLHDTFKAMHRQFFEDMRSLGMSFDEAMDKASALVSTKAKETVAGLIDAGHLALGKSMVDAYSSPTATALLTDKTDENGNVVNDKDGKPVKVLDDTKYDPSGRLWMSVKDVNELSAAYAGAKSRAISQMKANAKAASDAARDEADRLIGDAKLLFMNMDVGKTIPGPKGKNDKPLCGPEALHKFLGRANAIPDPGERARAIGAIQSEYDKRADDVDKAERAMKSANSLDMFQKELNDIDDKTDANGDVALMLAGVQGAEASVCDAIQAKILRVKIALRDGVIPDGSRAFWKDQLSEYEKDLDAANRGIIAKVFSENMTVSKSGSREMIKAYGDDSIEVKRLRYGPTYHRGKKIAVVTPDFGDDGRILNAEDIVFRRNIGGKDYYIDGETMSQVTRKLMPKMRVALDNSPENVNRFFDSLFQYGAKVAEENEMKRIGGAILGRIDITDYDPDAKNTVNFMATRNLAIKATSELTNAISANLGNNTQATSKE